MDNVIIIGGITSSINNREQSRLLYTVNQELIINHQLKSLKKFNCPISILTGDKPSVLISSVEETCNIVYYKNYATKSIPSMLSELMKNMSGQILCVYNHVLFQDIYNIDKNENYLLVDTSKETNKEVGLLISNNRAICFNYTFKQKWGNLFILNDKTKDCFVRLSNMSKNHNLLNHEILNKMLDNYYFNCLYDKIFRVEYIRKKNENIV